MKATAKYLFDENFAAGDPTITLVEHERRPAAALALIAGGMDKLERALSAIEARLETEAVEVAVAVAAKLAPELIAREPLAEIAALATESFRHLVATPHVVVRVGADIYDDAKQKLEDIAQSRGFEGRLVVQAEAGMAAGDCRIEWDEGGVTRDPEATRAAIDDVVARYVAARLAAVAGA